MIPSSDILSRGVPMEEVGDDPVHLLLYGTNGVGKTTFACQFPKPLALVSVEPAGRTGGAKSVKRIPGITHFRFDKCADVLALGTRLLRGDHDFVTVVFDSGTSLDAMQLSEVCGWDMTEIIRVGKSSKISADQYIERSEQVRKVLRPFLDLPTQLVVICNEKDHNYKADDQQQGGSRNRLVQDLRAASGGLQTEAVIGPAMAGAGAKWIGDACDYICQLYVDKEYETRTRAVGKEGTANYKESTILVETGKWVRKLRTSYHPNFVARVRSEAPEVVPEFVGGTSPAEMYANFMKMVRGEPQDD